MISDVLYQAAKDVGRYLDDPSFATVYPKDDALTERIEHLYDEMVAVRKLLDKRAIEPFESHNLTLIPSVRYRRSDRAAKQSAPVANPILITTTEATQ